MSEPFDTRQFLDRLKNKKLKNKKLKDKKEWLFALGVVAAGLEREGNLDAAANEEISAALKELKVSEKELRGYLKENRRKLLRFLDS